jgi:TusA-related sulfurtransferase
VADSLLFKPSKKCVSRQLTLKKEINHQLDLRGLFVPIALLKATQAFRGLDPGETLEIVGSDSETREDLFKVLDASRFELIALQDEAGFYRVLLRKR